MINLSYMWVESIFYQMCQIIRLIDMKSAQIIDFKKKRISSKICHMLFNLRDNSFKFNVNIIMIHDYNAFFVIPSGFLWNC